MNKHCIDLWLLYSPPPSVLPPCLRLEITNAIIQSDNLLKAKTGGFILSEVPVSALGSWFSTAGRSSWWCPPLWFLKGENHEMSLWPTLQEGFLWKLRAGYEEAFSLSVADLPGFCWTTNGCCCRKYLMYPFTGLFGGTLAWEVRHFTGVRYVGRTPVHLKEPWVNTDLSVYCSMSCVFPHPYLLQVYKVSFFYKQANV